MTTTVTIVPSIPDSKRVRVTTTNKTSGSIVLLKNAETKVVYVYDDTVLTVTEVDHVE